MADPTPIMDMLLHQKVAFWNNKRMQFWLWRRQARKSTTMAMRALRRMMERKDHLVTMVSASVNLGTEVLLKEAWVWRRVLEGYRALIASNPSVLLESNAQDDAGELLDVDAIADLFDHSKLEVRIRHSNTCVSRTKVVAPNPDTAVGWTGDVYMDEGGRMPELKDVFEAVLPILDSNPDFELIMATTPPPDDKHYSYELFLPPQQEWPVTPKGNWYEAPCGIEAHRFDAWDGYAAGLVYYHPKTRAPITPEEHRALQFDKIAWDRNHALKFIAGGVAAVALADIQRAMVLGRGQCVGNASTEVLVA